MLALTGGELGMVLFIFVLTWGAGWLPRAAERWGERSVRGGAGPRREG